MNFRYWLLGVKLNCVGSMASRWEVCSLGWTGGCGVQRVTSVVDEQDAHGMCVCRETDKGAEDGTERAPTGISKEEQRLHELGTSGIRDGEGDKSVRGCRT